MTDPENAVADVTAASLGTDVPAAKLRRSDLAIFVRRRRLQAGLTQSDLAARAGLSVDTVSALERGLRRRLYPSTARSLAKALGLGEPDQIRLVELSSRHLLAAGADRFRPPSAVPPTHPRGVPSYLTSFVGRREEIESVSDRLRTGARLLTIVGPGGVGKSRLSIEVVRACSGMFGDDIWFVDLSHLGDDGLVEQTIAGCLSARPTARRSFIDAIVDTVRDRTALLVLDGCERVVASCARLAAVLLARCALLTVLATSRQRLAVSGEHVCGLRPLPIRPSATLRLATQPELKSIAGAEAVRLFVDRAAVARPAFTLTANNLDAVTAICRRLDGLPLAIELAAARIRVLPVEQIAARLNDKFRLLRGFERFAPDRHQALGPLFDWSHDLLSSEERIVFRRVSVFAGGCSLDAAERVCAGDDINHDEVLDLLTALVDKSLMTVEQHGGKARFRMLDSIAEYAAAKLDDSGETQAVKSRHWQFFLELADRGPDNAAKSQPKWISQLIEDQDNVRAALEWTISDARDARAGLRLVTALGPFWLFGHLVREGISWQERFLAAAADEDSQLRATVLTQLARAAWLTRDPDKGIPAASAALGVARRIHDPARTVDALRALALNQATAGHLLKARANFEEAVELARAAADQEQLANVLVGLGFVILSQGNLDTAQTVLQDAGDRALSAGAQEALINAHGLLAYCALLRDDAAEARRLFRVALSRAAPLDHAVQVASALAGIAIAATLDGEPEYAATLFAASSALAEQSGIELGPAEQERVSAACERVQADLGDVTWDAAWRRGRTLPLDEVLRQALSGPDDDH